MQSRESKESQWVNDMEGERAVPCSAFCVLRSEGIKQYLLGKGLILGIDWEWRPAF